MNKLLITMGVCLSVTSTAYAQEVNIHDHYRDVIEQKPYHVEVCRNVNTSGDKTGDALAGAIIGGIIGNNVGNIENGGALGAVIGGMLGHNNSNKTGGVQRQCRTEIRYNENSRTIYSHSHIEFWYEGRKYNLKFKK